MNRAARLLTLAMAALLAAGARAECAPEIARLAAHQGIVKIQKQGNARRLDPQDTTATLCAGDAVFTFAGQAVITLSGGGNVVMDPQTTVRFASDANARLEQGKALFTLQQRGKAQGYSVDTRLSVIGVKGTQFLVQDDASELAVVLQRGRVEVASLAGEFEHYRAAALSEFEAYRQREREAFEAYRRQQREEFIGYVKSITLAAGQALAISGAKAVQAEVSAEARRDIERMEGIANRSLDANEP
jgi:hypothetical protein